MTGGPGEDPMVDLAAILRSEHELSGLSERRGQDHEPDEPLTLLAALAADVDDDAPDGVGDLGDLPAALPGALPGGRPGAGAAPGGTGTDGAPVRTMRGRRWMAAAIGVAAAVVGTTGVAAAGAHVFPPFGGLFDRPSPSRAAAGPERSESPAPTTPPPATGGGGHTDGPSRPPGHGRTPTDPPASHFAPGVDGPGSVPAPLSPQSPSASPASTSPSPTPSDSTDGGATSSPSPSDSSPPPDHPWPPRGLTRLDREIDRLARPSPPNGR